MSRAQISVRHFRRRKPVLGKGSDVHEKSERVVEAKQRAVFPHRWAFWEAAPGRDRERSLSARGRAKQIVLCSVRR